jgi:hypothetical protein
MVMGILRENIMIINLSIDHKKSWIAVGKALADFIVGGPISITAKLALDGWGAVSTKAKKGKESIDEQAEKLFQIAMFTSIIHTIKQDILVYGHFNNSSEEIKASIDNIIGGIGLEVNECVLEGIFENQLLKILLSQFERWIDFIGVDEHRKKRLTSYLIAQASPHF